MNLKLTKNKISFLTKTITEYIQSNDEIDYNTEIGSIRFKIYQLIVEELKIFAAIEEQAREKILSQKKNIPEGSREWEILFRKYTGEALNGLGRIWN